MVRLLAPRLDNESLIVILHEPEPGAEPATEFEPGEAPETLGQHPRKLAAE